MEIGVHTGRFAKTILGRWNGRALWLVDPWRHEVDYLDSWNASDKVMEHRLKIARSRLAPFSNRTIWLRDRSEHAAPRFADNSLDFIYLDANHSYKHVRQDLILWFPKLKSGGVFAGHDYFNAIADEKLEPYFFGDYDPALLTSYGVKAAVDEFTLSMDIFFQTT